MGLTVEEMEGPPFGVLTDNWLTASVFAAMDSQWRYGMNGPTGLDYSALPIVMRLKGVPQADRSSVFEGVQIMERVALKTMHTKRG